MFMAACVVVATALVLNAFQANLLYFFTPSQIASGEAKTNALIRVGGLVAHDSVQHKTEGLEVTFDVTDTVHTLPVSYEGVLPDLFKEGQGVVVKGRISESGKLQATEVLAKHDENYMPPEVASALEAAETLQYSQ